MTDAEHEPPSPSREGAPVIVSNEPGTFAYGVFHDRHPALIEKVRDAFPFTPEQNARLDRLLEEATVGVIEALNPNAHDHAAWQRWGMSDHVGKAWTDAPFLWAESYFYRKLLDAVGYFEPGPWQGIDPFEPFKTAELHGGEADAELRALDEVASLSTREQANALLQSALWGNRADLGFQVSMGDGGLGARESHLVADDTAGLWSLLDGSAPARVCVVADNAGRELLPDLVLIDHLLATGRAADVVLHVKPHPYYVSDATLADVLACLRRLTNDSGRARETGLRLWKAVQDGRIIVRAHPFSCAPLPYSDMPEDLRQDFASAIVTIMKGDLNYRRLVGDRMRPATTPFDEVTAYFPGRVAALRTLKSDVIVGLDERVEEALNSTEHAWRTSGTHALIQLRS